MTPLSAQFVPIKIDVASDAYNDWSSLFPHEGGKGIPVVYIIRADGKKQYAQTGALGTAALTRLLNSNLATAGTILNQAQVEQLVGIQEKLARSIKRKKWADAIDLVNSVTTIEWSGIETSLAQPAVVMQGLVEQLSQGVQSEATTITDSVMGPSFDLSQKIDVALQFGKLEFEVQGSSQVDTWLAPSRNIIAMDAELAKRVDWVQKILAYKTTREASQRAVVERIAQEQRGNKIGKLAAKLVGTPGQPRRNRRTWVSANGNFKLVARYHSQTADRVKLIRTNGEKIDVEISKLCEADIQYLRQQK